MQVNKQEQQAPYFLLGEEEGLLRLVDVFYRIMDEQADMQAVRNMHEQDLQPIKQRLFFYLSGWLGGPDLYFEKYKTVCITKTHSDFVISSKERDQWLLCMQKALDEVGASEEVKNMLELPLYKVADMLCNT